MDNEERRTERTGFEKCTRGKRMSCKRQIITGRPSPGRPYKRWNDSRSENRRPVVEIKGEEKKKKKKKKKKKIFFSDFLFISFARCFQNKTPNEFLVSPILIRALEPS
jgi:hypothetical protein